MDIINGSDIGIEIVEVPDIFVVVINKDELDSDNSKKIFQFALKEDIEDETEEVMVYIASFDQGNNIVKPFMSSGVNENGVVTKNLFPVYDKLYAKRKEDLVIIE